MLKTCDELQAITINHLTAYMYQRTNNKCVIWWELGWKVP